MDTEVCYPDDISYHHMPTGWLSWSWYLIRMSYDNVIMLSGWHMLPFLNHPDKIASFDFSQRSVALQRFRETPLFWSYRSVTQAIEMSSYIPGLTATPAINLWAPANVLVPPGDDVDLTCNCWLSKEAIHEWRRLREDVPPFQTGFLHTLVSVLVYHCCFISSWQSLLLLGF